MDLRSKGKDQTLETPVKPKRKKRFFGDSQVNLRNRNPKPKEKPLEQNVTISGKTQRMRRYREKLKKQSRQTS